VRQSARPGGIDDNKHWMRYAVAAAAFVVLGRPCEARAQCPPDGWRHVLLTAGVAGAAGVGAALGSSAIVATADKTRDYKFYVGAAAGGGVTLGLSVLYGLVDYYSGCRIAESSPGGFAWEVPVVTFVVGAALPVAIWGAAPKKDDPAATAQPLVAPSLFAFSGTF
jgi:hypothetical protein